MKKQLLRLLFATIAVMPSFTALAVTEQFVGATGKNYVVDYEAGVVGRIENNVATLVSPEQVVELELQPYWNHLLELAADTDLTYDKFQQGNDLFSFTLEAFEKNDETYYKVVEAFKTAAKQNIETYKKIIEDYRGLLSRSNAAGAPVRSESREARESFLFGIQSVINDFDYADFIVKFTAERLDDYLDEIVEFAEKIDEGGMEISEMQDYFQEILDKNKKYFQDLLEWMEMHEDEGFSEEDIQDIIDILEDLVYDLELELEYIPENPMNYMSAWIEACRDSMVDVYDNYKEASEYLTSLAVKLNDIIKNFSGVLFAGTNGVKTGMYYGIVENEGSLILPDYIVYGENEYRVVGANGNIFSGVPEEVSFNGYTLVLPETIRQIHNEAFAIDGFVAVLVPTSEVPNTDENCFTENVYANATLYVTDNWVSSYKARDPWKKFHEIKPLSDSSVSELESGEISVSVEDGRVIVSGCEDVIVVVYSLDGAKIYEGRANSLELPSRGLYLINISGKIFKVMF